MGAAATGASAIVQFPDVSIAAREGKLTTSNIEWAQLSKARTDFFSSIAATGQMPPEQVIFAFRLIRTVDRQCRLFITNVLGAKYGQNWEKNCVPPDIYKRWTERQSTAIKAGKSPDLAPIEFADFTDYKPIITMNKNWLHFKEFFRNKQMTEVSFQRLFPYRLDTMHSRDIEIGDALIIAGDCQWLLNALGCKFF